LDFRRAAASELYAVYKSAVAELTKALEVDKALVIKAEMEGFVEKEKQRLGLSSSIPAVPPVAVPAVEPGERLTGFSFPDFVDKFLDEINRVASFDTGAKRDQEHRKMMERFDQNLRSHSVRFHFPITEVTTNDGRRFTLHLGLPDEMKGIPGIRLIFDDYLLEGSAARDAVNIRPGDTFELFGKLRISTAGSRGGPSLALIDLRTDGVPEYYFYPQTFDYVIRKKRDRGNDPTDDTRSKKTVVPSALRPAVK
jgi:hypothetical protein